MRILRSADQLMDAEPPYLRPGPSGVATFAVERPVPSTGIDAWDGWREYAVRVEFDEGRVFKAVVVAELEAFRTVAAGPLRTREVKLVGGPIALTRSEAAEFEREFADDMAERGAA